MLLCFDLGMEHSHAPRARLVIVSRVVLKFTPQIDRVAQARDQKFVSG